MTAGSAQVMPLVPHQCCGPAILVVAFPGGGGFGAAAATGEMAPLETSMSGAAIIAAESPIPRVRLI
jgi:hypothetical protein